MNSFFHHTFANRVEHIRVLRSNDPELAEIGQDYEILMGLMPLDAEDPMIEGVNDSLADLEREFRYYLGPPDDTKPASPSLR